MPSPLDKLSEAFKTSQGQMGKTSTEEIGALSAKTGQLTTPQDPMSAAAIGGSEQQAAMAGSRASLRSQIRQSMDLAAGKRQGVGVAMDQAAAEKAKQEAAGLTSAMGSLDSRVQTIVSKQVGKAGYEPQVAPDGTIKFPEAKPGQKEALAGTATGGTQPSLKISDSALQGVPEQNRESIKPLLAKLGAGTATPADLLQINQMMGKTTQAEMLSADALKKMFVTGSEQIGQALASGLGDTLKVSQLDIDSLGIGSKADIANKLGMSVQDVENLSASDFMQRLNNYRQKELTHTSNLQQRAADPLLGAAERQAARMELKGAGATGLRSAEESVADLKEQINKAETVSFNGQNTSVANLLSEDNMKAMVKSYLDNPMSDSSRDLAKNEPKLVDWINANQAGLNKMLEGVTKAQTDFAAIQEETKKLATPSIDGAPSQISDNAMKALIQDWKNLTDSKPQMPAALSILHDPNANSTVKKALYSTIQNLETLGTQYVAELKDLSASELQQLGLTNPGSAEKYVEYVKSAKAIQSMPADPEQLASHLGMDIATISSRLNESFLMGSFGLGESEGPLTKILDKDGDGKLDFSNMAEIKNSLSSLMGGGPMSLKDMVAAGKSVANVPTLAGLSSTLAPKKLDGETKDLYGAISSTIQDRNFADNEAEQAAQNVGNDVGKIAKMAQMIDRARSQGAVGGSGVEKLQEIGRNRAMDNYKRNLLPDSLNGGDGEEYGHWGNRVNSGQALPDNVKQDMEKAVKDLQSQQPGNYLERQARDTLLDRIRGTLQNNADLANKQRQEAEDRARKEAEERQRRAAEEQAKKETAASMAKTRMSIPERFRV